MPQPLGMLLGCRQASGRRLGSSQSCTAATCSSKGAAGCPSDGGFPAQWYFEIDMCSVDAPPMGAVVQNTSAGVRNHAIRVAASQRASSVCVSFARSSQTLLRSRSLIVPQPACFRTPHCLDIGTHAFDWTSSAHGNPTNACRPLRAWYGHHNQPSHVANAALHRAQQSSDCRREWVWLTKPVLCYTVGVP